MQTVLLTALSVCQVKESKNRKLPSFGQGLVSRKITLFHKMMQMAKSNSYLQIIEMAESLLMSNFAVLVYSATFLLHRGNTVRLFGIAWFSGKHLRLSNHFFEKENRHFRASSNLETRNNVFKCC